MKRVFQRSAIYAVIIIFIIYILIVILISGFYNTIPLVIKYASSVNWIELGLSIFFSLIIGALVAINAVVVYSAYRQRKTCREAGTVATLGTMGGLAAGICPLCVTGLLPIALGLFGIAFSFATLPFKGLEIQMLSILLLALSLWMMTRRSFTTFK